MPATPDQPAAPAAADAAAPQEWKPEPRQWTWKDLFTAPMLAFKPKCMLISALTLIALGLWVHLFNSFAFKFDSSEKAWLYLAVFVWFSVGLVVFSIGATLVSVFMRADLLDDEFLSLGEAIGQFKGRIVPALLVPLFLFGLLVGVNLFLIYVPELLCSIPLVGSAIYALMYPLGYFLALFAVLLLIAVSLSLFVFPGIIAIRKHGWFDNVVDTIEAVGTKPHVLVGSLILTTIMVWVAFGIGNAGMSYLKAPSRTSAKLLPGDELARTEYRADQVRLAMVEKFDPLRQLGQAYNILCDSSYRPHGMSSASSDYDRTPVFSSREHFDAMSLSASQRLDGSSATADAEPASDKYYTWGTGLVTGAWQGVIMTVLLGYCMNMLLAGGMLTYLLVREDDYWDDEDLEDLDKLAKELEEEAKRDEAAAPASSTPAAAPSAAAPAPAATDKPVPPAAT